MDQIIRVNIVAKFLLGNFYWKTIQELILDRNHLYVNIAQILFLRTPSVLEAVLGQHTGVGGPAVHLRHLSVLVVRRLARSRVLLLIVI